MSTVQNGLPGTPAFVGFGAWGQGFSPFTSPLNVDNIVGNVTGIYFLVPFTMEINGLIAFFNPFLLPADTPAITIKAQLYEADETGNIFSPIEETLVTLSPSLTNATPYGSLVRGEVRKNRVVEKDTKLMLIFSATSDGPDPVDSIIGYASASLIYT